jgi:hypothetical protein
MTLMPRVFKYATIDGRECTSWLAEKRVNTTRGSLIQVKQFRPKKYASNHGPEGLCGRVKFYIRVVYETKVLDLARVNFFKWDQARAQTRSEWCINPTAGVYTQIPYVLVSDIKCLVLAPEVPALGELGKKYFVLHMDQAPLGLLFIPQPTKETPRRRPGQGRSWSYSYTYILDIIYTYIYIYIYIYIQLIKPLSVPTWLTLALMRYDTTDSDGLKEKLDSAAVR